MTANEPMPKVVLILRPFGYLLVTSIYTALLAVVVVFGWGGLFIGIDRGFGEGSSGYDVLVSLLVVVVAGPILGGALGIATALTASLTMLGGLAFVRSLTPAYATTTLTHTVRSDNAVGPPRLTKGAISLLPTRHGRFADFALRFNLAAQGLDWWVLLAFAWLGVADMITAGWVKWPATGGWVAFWLVVSMALVALGVVGLVRAITQPDRQRRRAGRPARRPLGTSRLP
ncbi:hypothetical protein [Nocardioides sp. CER19]|uniref:hypothetical protein n=1 Tax=Nocardioides sp. CER19 TaxID=3038538 RepID=UPI0024494751|nr:hypothetical protein [Nocardioides sp. CER19]MDH2413798.1 hypothetical protein [Nocardioides sp. CER19]